MEDKKLIQNVDFDPEEKQRFLFDLKNEVESFGP